MISEVKMLNRHMAEMVKYIKQMTIKKTFNGLDRDDVYDKMMDLLSMFQQYGEESDKVSKEKEAKSLAREKDLKLQIESLRKKLNQAGAEKEKYESWIRHKENAGQEVCDHLKQITECITLFEDALKEGLRVHG